MCCNRNYRRSTKCPKKTSLVTSIDPYIFKGFWIHGDFSWEGDGTFPGYMKTNTVKENHIGSAVRDPSVQTDRQTEILLLYYMDYEIIS